MDSIPRPRGELAGPAAVIADFLSVVEGDRPVAVGRVLPRTTPGKGWWWSAPIKIDVVASDIEGPFLGVVTLEARDQLL